MSENETTLLTQHALLVAWGEYAQSLGLLKKIESVPLDQKEVEHRPQLGRFHFVYRPADSHSTGAAALQNLCFCTQLTILAAGCTNLTLTNFQE